MGEKHSSNRGGNGRPAFPVYPILFGIYPVMALAAYNITQIDFSSTSRSIGLSFILALILFGLLRLIMRKWTRAAFLSMLLLTFFYSYGHIYNLIKNASLFGFAFGRHRILLLIWTMLGGAGIWISARKSFNLSRLTPWLNLISVFLLVYPIYQIVHAEVITHVEWTGRATSSLARVAPGSHLPYPDIYYIILDGYGRTDEINEVYNYDNSAFINALVKRGFVVAGCSQSNYAYTALSLASSLNLDYLDKLSVDNNEQAYPLIQSNKTRLFLEAQGYTTVAFESGYRWTQWENADYYFKFQPSASALNGFEFLFLQTTLLRFPLDYINMSNQPTTFESIHHDEILSILHTLKNLPNLARSPKFVFAHLVVPHPPYVFGPAGELVTYPTQNQANLQGYKNAVIFISNALLPVVDEIIANSKTPPIIIIQGDHGSPLWNRPDQRMKILNAYYLPSAEAKLYPTITPVNTFRMIFNAYFSQSYSLLKDESWYSPFENRYDFQLVPNQCRN